MDGKENKICHGHCERCSVYQRTYCAAQKAYYLEQDINELKMMLAVLAQGGVIDTIVTREQKKEEEETA